MKSFIGGSACALILAFAAQTASGSVLLSFQETGGNVVGSLSGALDLTDAVVNSSITQVSQFKFYAGTGLVDLGTPAFVNAYDITGPTSFGPGTGHLIDATSSSGDLFGIYGYFQAVMLPYGYVSSAPLSATVTYAGQTYASMGITPGTYRYELPNDTITVQFGVAPVPLPADGLLLMTGLAGLAALKRRRRGA